MGAGVRGIAASQEHEDGDFDFALGGVESLIDGFEFGSGRLNDDATSPISQLLVVGSQIDHEVAERLPEPDHADRGDCVEDDLLSGAGFEAGRTGDDLCPDQDFDGMVDVAAENRVGIADDSDGECPELPGPTNGADRVGSAAGSGDRYDRVPLNHFELIYIVSAGRRVIFHRFPWREESVEAPGDDSDDPVGVESGWALGGIQQPKTSGRSGPDVNEPSILLQAFDHRVDGGGDGCVGRSEGFDRVLLVIRHELHQRQGVAQIEVGQFRSLLFG